MLCIINRQYTHNQGKFCQNFQFFHIYSTVTSFSVNLHHFPVDKNEISVKITEISVNKTEISAGMQRNFVFQIQNFFSVEITEISRNFARNSVSAGWRDSVQKRKGEPWSSFGSSTAWAHAPKHNDDSRSALYELVDGAIDQMSGDQRAHDFALAAKQLMSLPPLRKSPIHCRDQDLV